MNQEEIDAFLKNSKEGKLSSRDRRLANGVKFTPAEKGRDLLDSISPASLKELQQTINETKDVKARQILLEQQKQALNLKNQLQMRALVQILPDLDSQQ